MYAINQTLNSQKTLHITVLVVNYSISNTIVLEIPYFTTKPAIYCSHMWAMASHILVANDSYDKNNSTPDCGIFWSGRVYLSPKTTTDTQVREVMNVR